MNKAKLKITEPLIKVRITNHVFNHNVDKKVNSSRLTTSLNGMDSIYRVEQVTIHPREFIELVSVDGWGFTSWMKGGGKVNNANFLESNHLPVDVDGTISLEDFFSYDFAKHNCYGYYTSKSHTKKSHRFRALFRTERDITNQEDYSYAIQGLFQVFDNKLDEQCKNSGRIWFGSSNATKAEYLGDDKVIDNESLDNLIKLGKKSAKIMKAAPTITDKGFSGSLEADYLFYDSKGHMFTPMDVFHDHKKRQCKCPFHNDKEPSAFVTYYDKTDSVWFICSSSKCGEKRAMNPIASDVFAKKVKLMAGKDTQVINLEERFIPDIEVEDHDRLVFVKSPKGTGKTQFLSNISKQAQTKKQRLLNLGHRVFLLSNLSERLKTDYYLEHEKVSDNFSLCINSLSRIKPEIDKPFDYVILDESEQFLINMISDTLKQNRNEIFNNLIWVLQNAKHVICCDADLTYDVSIDLVRMMMGLNDDFSNYKIYNNEWKYDRGLNLYASKNHLIANLYNDLCEGKRVFITTNNSKDFISYIETIIGFIEDENGVEIPRLTITADTNSSDEVKRFIKDPESCLFSLGSTLVKNKGIENLIVFDDKETEFQKKTEDKCKKYQVVLASPTLSTGVSIEGEVFDSVYGIFNNCIYTYQECDQAISRVRECNNINVFIQPTSIDNVKSEKQLLHEIIESEIKTSSLGVYGADGRELNAVEKIYAKFYARIRTFYDNCLIGKPQKFARLVQSNGYKVNYIRVNEKLNDFGLRLIKSAKEHTTDRVINHILNSDNLEHLEADMLKSQNIALNVVEKYALRKYKIADFFGVDVASVTEEQVRSVEKNNAIKLFSNIALVYAENNTLINSDDSERLYSKDISPHYKHRARQRELFLTLSNAAGIDIDKIHENANMYKIIDGLKIKSDGMKNGSRGQRAIRKKIKEAISGIKIIIEPEQIDRFANCVDTYKEEINQVFGTNIKKPTEDSAKLKVFNSLMNRIGVEISACRKGKSGSEGKQYYIDYSSIKMIASKVSGEKYNIKTETTTPPVLHPEIPETKLHRIDIGEFTKNGR